MKLTGSEAKRQGAYLEHATDKALESLTRIGLVLNHAHFESKDEFPDFWTVLEDNIRINIECKNWKPDIPRIEYDIKAKFTKKWESQAVKVVVIATYSNSLNDGAKRRLQDYLDPVWIAVLGHKVFDENEYSEIESVLKPIFSEIISSKREKQPPLSYWRWISPTISVGYFDRSMRLFSG